MSRQWSVLQAFGHINPPQTILVQYERRIARLAIQALGIRRRPIIGCFFLFKIRHVQPGPFPLVFIPPNQLLELAPRATVGPRAGPVVNNAPIAGPGEPPAVPITALRFSPSSLAHAVPAKHTRINPAAGSGRTICFELLIPPELRSVVRTTIAVEPTFEYTLRPFLGIGFPAIDLRQHAFDNWLAFLILWIPPVQCAQRFIQWIIGGPRPGDQSLGQLADEPTLATTVTRRIHRFFTELKQALSVGKATLFFGVAGGRQQKD